MDRDPEHEPNKQLKRWETPAVRKYDLSEYELAQLRTSEDPAALLLKMKPKFKSDR